MSETEKFHQLVDDLNKMRKAILVVEDDQRDRELAMNSFDGSEITERFFVDFAINGREAIERLVRQDYDIIFLDLKLPVMDGTKVLQYCKETVPEIPIVVVTAYPDGDLMKSALACAPIMSYVGVITKPLTRDIVIETLRKHRLL